MNQSGAVVGFGDCLINVDETLVFDAVFYQCLKAHSYDRLGLSDWVKFSWIINDFEKVDGLA